MEGQAHVIKTRSYILSVSGQLVTQVFLQDNNKFHTAVGYNRNTTIYLRYTITFHQHEVVPAGRRRWLTGHWGVVTVYVTLVTWSFWMVKSRVPYEISSVPSDVVW